MIDLKLVTNSQGVIEITNCATCPFNIKGVRDVPHECFLDPKVLPEAPDDDPNFPAQGCLVVAVKKIEIRVNPRARIKDILDCYSGDTAVDGIMEVVKGIDPSESSE